MRLHCVHKLVPARPPPQKNRGEMNSEAFDASDFMYFAGESEGQPPLAKRGVRPAMSGIEDCAS